MFSQTTEYALRVTVALAKVFDQPLAAETLAELTKVPRGYLYKVLQRLCRRGVVQSIRGVNGGYRLKRAPTDVQVLRVIEAVDPIPRIQSCPLELPEHGCRLCPLHRCLDEAMVGVERALASVTLADLIDPLDPPHEQNTVPAREAHAPQRGEARGLKQASGNEESNRALAAETSAEGNGGARPKGLTPRRRAQQSTCPPRTASEKRRRKQG